MLVLSRLSDNVSFRHTHQGLQGDTNAKVIMPGAKLVYSGLCLHIYTHGDLE